jgi:membrane fusion protein, multidrug efflux system
MLMRLVLAIVIMICALAMPASARAQQQQAAAPVGTVKAERSQVAQTLDFVGRVESINKVEVKARVEGYLDAVMFKEGDLVAENAPLYRIERGLFEAAVEQSQGALERSKGSVVLAQQQLSRAQELLKKQAGTEVARDQAVAAAQAAKGNVMTDEANLKTAEINLGYTDITSPIAGKVGKTNITKGNVVGPSTGSLTVIVSQDPMYVSFPVSQRDFLRAQEAGRKTNVAAIKVRIRFADGTMYDQMGNINFIDVTVDRATDTVLVRGTVPNPTGSLIDGQLVRVLLESGTPEEKILIPQAALIADQEGVYVFAVEDGKAVVKRVKTGGAQGTDVVIDQGLTGGEEVIVQGLQGVRPGAPVKASALPATIGRS